MKRVGIVLLSIIVMMSIMFMFTSCSPNTDVDVEAEYTKEYEGTTLNVYNWGEYISDGSEGSLDVVAAFEKLTGIKVNYVTYESNEVMYSKLKSGSVTYDVVIPSDYMIARLKNEGMLRPIDYSKITNYKYISEDYKNLYFDEKNEYTVPYNVGMVGLIYNKTIVKNAPDSWNVMWDAQYKDNILMFNNSRDSFAIAQKLLGQSFNTTNTADWDAAAQKLKEQSPILQARVMDEVFSKMENGNAALAPYYAGDFLSMKAENDDLEFVYPKEGVNIFVDAMCVPKNAQNYEAAMLFINFMTEPNVALANAEYICYASPNTAVLNNDEYTYKDNEILYPPKDKMPKVEYFHDLDADTKSYYENLWIDITSS